MSQILLCTGTMLLFVMNVYVSATDLENRPGVVAGLLSKSVVSAEERG